MISYEVVLTWNHWGEMLVLNTPEWLERRGGSLEHGADGKSWFVVLNNHQPQYRLVPVPVEGKFGCAITQTISGKRLMSSSVGDSQEQAITGGLDDLRKTLGWE